MQNTTVGVREFRNHFSHYLRLVQAGAYLLITDHGRPVGQIMPVPVDLTERLTGLIRAGVLDWDGGRLSALKPVGETKGTTTVSDLVIEGRD